MIFHQLLTHAVVDGGLLGEEDTGRFGLSSARAFIWPLLLGVGQMPLSVTWVFSNVLPEAAGGSTPSLTVSS